MKEKGKRIKTFKELHKQKKSVWVELWKRPSPMAFIISLPHRLVAMYLNNGKFYATKEANNGKTSNSEKDK